MKKRKTIPYNPTLKQLARNLRNNSTLSEVLLWEHLKGKRMKEYDFHRQKPIDNYIVDFFCNELMLAVEIDGDSHSPLLRGDLGVCYKFEEDQQRQKRLESLDITFLRFDDIDVKQDINSVILRIEEWIEEYEK